MRKCETEQIKTDRYEDIEFIELELVRSMGHGVYGSVCKLL